MSAAWCGADARVSVRACGRTAVDGPGYCLMHLAYAPRDLPPSGLGDPLGSGGPQTDNVIAPAVGLPTAEDGRSVG
jgi:hypothetical protein